jgi:hypothetical protein
MQERKTTMLAFLWLRKRIFTLVCIALVPLGWVSGMSGPEFAQQPANTPSDWVAAALNQRESQVPLGKTATLNILDTVDGSGHKLKLAWTVVPRNSFSLQVTLVNKIGPADLLYKTFTPGNALLTINGGYYQIGRDKTPSPAAFVLSNGKVVHADSKQSAGDAFLFSTGQPGADVGPTCKLPGVQQCLQSRPILLQAGTVVVKSTGSKTPYNRMAVGTTRSGDLFIAAAFSDDLQAIRLYDFARFMSLLQSKRGIPLKTVVNLDGVNDAHLFAPGNALQLGYHATNYVPDVISILPR